MSETKEQPGRAIAAQPRKEDHKPLREVTKVSDLFTNAEFLNRMSKAVPSIITPTMMLSSLAASVRKSPDLAQCSVADVAGKALMLAQAALPPDTPLQLSHLIPFKDQVWNPQTRKREPVMVCQAIIGYHGLLDLAYRSGRVSAVIGRAAWRDEVDARLFEFEFGTEEHLRHIPGNAAHDLSPQAQAAGRADWPMYAYAQATLSDNKVRPFEVWPWHKVAAIRDASPAYRYAKYQLEEALKAGRTAPAGFLRAPWVAFAEQMGAKTMVKRLLNWLPRSVEYAALAALDDAQDRRPIDMGMIIDSTDYVSAAADAAEISGDPSAAYGMRDQPGEDPEQSQPEPPASPPAKATPRQRAPTRATPVQQEGPPDTDYVPPGDASPPANDAAERPAPTALRAVPTEPPPAPAFDAWLLDENGEPVGDEPLINRLHFARQLEEQWAKSTNKDRLLEQNADAIADASTDRMAAALIASMRQQPEAPPAAEPEPVVIELKGDRGKPNHGVYLKEFTAAARALTEATYLPFVAANLPTLKSIPPSTRALCAKELVQRAEALGFDPPSMLRDGLKGEDADAAYQRDATAVAARIAELQDCTTAFAVRQWKEGAVFRSFAGRLQAEGKADLLKRLETAYHEKAAQFGNGAT